ncbi:hypothetical protein [Streptomyces antimicrobicus]|uniref:Uncharacterized protein n=1 Tax=Streptomyces antimicrobicus TaxID=2883108 RepID=A0ABS8BAK6_9ACTN|nr:hypothetical protein [Streptomyces antimicrobicus]MCB5181663.1 hypothetical protein [Streptomyces antimicrobicus]
MICPHCEKNLLRKERTGNVCSHCRKRYALDPKTNPLALNDLRVRRVVQQLTGEAEALGTGQGRAAGPGPQVAVSTGQLWYALSRRRLKEAGISGGCAGGTAGFAAFAGLVGVLTDATALLFVCAVLLVVAAGCLTARLAGVGRGVPRVTHAQFKDTALREWRQVYGALPAGVVDDTEIDPYRALPASPGLPAPTAVLVCPERSVAAFLAANGVPSRYGVALVPGPEGVRPLPGHLPVLALHDADVEGELLVRRLRQELPGRRVVDAGLPLRSVREPAKGVPYRDPARRPRPEQLRLLAGTGTVAQEELDRLAKGWRYPLVAVPPRKLLDVVTRLAEEAGRRTDPERRRAAAVGFMSWPDADGGAGAVGTPDGSAGGGR